MRCLRDRQCVLERNERRDAAEIAKLKARKALAESTVHKLTASLEKPEGGEQHWKKKAEKFIKRIGDLEQAVEKHESQDESLYATITQDFIQLWAYSDYSGTASCLGRLHASLG
jgi:chromosome segregation ATPase